jgi:hypothetical protein
VLRLQSRILKATLFYFRYSLPPVLFLIAPVFLILAQLNLYFSLRPLKSGEMALVKARFASLRVDQPDARLLEVSGGVHVDSDGVWIQSDEEVSWRIKAAGPGHHTLTVRSGNAAVQKEIVIGGKWDRVSHLRSGSLLDVLLYPGEDPIETDTGISSIEVTYPSLELELLGWKLHWMIIFIIFSLASAFLFRRSLGVEF